MYFMLIEVLDWQSKPTGDLRIELALSCKVGMSRFDHPFRKSAGASYFLEPYGVPEHYDSGVIWANGWPIAHGEDQLRFYHDAYSSWNTDEDRCEDSGCSGIGLATMEIDRYHPFPHPWAQNLALKHGNLLGS